MPDNGLHDLTEDATGFGRAEWRTCVDSLIRPRQVLEAYMTDGADGGGRYARPLRLYLVLCGVMMLVLFLMGGTEGMLAGFPTGDLATVIEGSGKSVDAFLADFDGWTSLTMVPLMCAIYALTTAPFLRWWDEEDLGWRRAFRGTFAFLNAATVPMLPICWLFYMPAYTTWGMLVLGAILIVTFFRMGPGRWYGSSLAGLGKSLLLTACIFFFALLGVIPVMAIGLAGAWFGP